ncbi:MAG: low specificity L-threonine aldolase [Firmicutes bacterium]|nr:low specificity L-threonine aldolase [Bacillota bacterium]
MTVKMIDLRSDTVTRPGPEMRTAMVQATVGDDVFSEDPTANLLEEEAAALVGKEAALFIPSGIMGNLIAVLTHTARGDAVILDPESHIFYYEAGGPSLVGGVQLWPVEYLHSNPDFATEKFKKAIRPVDQHFAPPTLLCLENTHNRNGGTILSPDKQSFFFQIAHEKGLAVHLDGARIFHAAIALNHPVTAFTHTCDSIMFCLSKGLGAPAGSILAGTKSFISRARRYRRLLGGGMRQIGILAAAGRLALKHIPHLEADHRLASRLAEGLARLPLLNVSPFPPPTNIVMLNVKDTGLTAREFVARLSAFNVRALDFDEYRVRLVTHRDLCREDIDLALAAIQDLCQKL